MRSVLRIRLKRHSFMGPRGLANGIEMVILKVGPELKRQYYFRPCWLKNNFKGSREITRRIYCSKKRITQVTHLMISGYLCLLLSLITMHLNAGHARLKYALVAMHWPMFFNLKHTDFKPHVLVISLAAPTLFKPK